MGNIIDMTLQQSDERLVRSEHAYVRLKERNGWNRKTAARMIGKVYQKGLRPGQVKGYLKRWVNNKAYHGNAGNEFILFGEKLYIFNEKTMITLLSVPSKRYIMNEV